MIVCSCLTVVLIPVIFSLSSLLPFTWLPPFIAPLLPSVCPSSLYFCLSSSARLSSVFSCLLFLSCSMSPHFLLQPPRPTPHAHTYHQLLPSRLSPLSQGSCSNSVLILQPTLLPSLIHHSHVKCLHGCIAAIQRRTPSLSISPPQLSSHS